MNDSFATYERGLWGPTSNSGPTFIDKLLFFLLFSGPPKFRLRDPNASLDAVIDWVVLLHTVVWCAAGLWIASKLWLSTPRVGIKLSSLEKTSLFFVGCLAVSILFSDGPALTTFKVCQLFVTLTFIAVYTRRYGVQACYDGIYFGSAALCVADAVAVLIVPSMVFSESEFGSLRFRGDLIAQTGVVGTIALVLLLSSSRQRTRLLTGAALALFGSVFLFSLMRTAYLALLVFLLVALWRAPDMKLLKRVARFAVLVIPIAILAGALTHLEEYRPAESIWTLSDRLGLWAYLVDMMWTTSRWFGLGYFSASRIYGPEYNPGLGTAHSVFVEVLAGGGIVSFAVFVVLLVMVVKQTFGLFSGTIGARNFAAVGLLLVTLCFLFVGSELEAEPAGFTFWALVVTVPILASFTNSKRTSLAVTSTPCQANGRS